MYDEFSSDYDRFVNWPGRLQFEMPFLLSLLRQIDGNGQPVRVLDAACGTGMHVLALAREGFSAAGADLSAGMIARARENAARDGLTVHLETAGFGSLAQTFHTNHQPFDAVLCLGNSLPHVLSPGEVSHALLDFAACLRPGGLLVIQNRNFDAVLSNHDRWMEPQSHSEGEREWTFLRFYDYEPDGLISFNIITLTRTGVEPWQQRVTTTQLYPLRRSELAQAIDEAGFTGSQYFGGLDATTFNPLTSGNLVAVARKTALSA